MSDWISTPFTPKGAPSVDLVALLLLGRERGYLTPDDLMTVLEQVELTPALINAVVGRVRAEGIAWRDDVEDDRPEDGLGLDPDAAGGPALDPPADLATPPEAPRPLLPVPELSSS